MGSFVRLSSTKAKLLFRLYLSSLTALCQLSFYARALSLLRLVFEEIALPPPDDAEGDEGSGDAAGQNHGYQHQQIL